jgi:hypothetical protein
MELVPIPDGKYLIYSSTLLYNICVVGMLIIGVDRFLAIKNTTKYYSAIRNGVYGVAAVIFIARTIRSILIFSMDMGTTFPSASYLQLFTIFPIYAILIGFDILAIQALWDIFEKTKLENKMVRKTGFYKLGLSVAIGLCFGIISIVIAILEAVSYQGNAPSFIDWWLITWITGSTIDQKLIIRDILKREETTSAMMLRKTTEGMTPIRKPSGGVY